MDKVKYQIQIPTESGQFTFFFCWFDLTDTMIWTLCDIIKGTDVSLILLQVGQVDY